MRISNNLGDAKSLITHPATTTHQRLTPAARRARHQRWAGAAVMRPRKHPDDVVEDLVTALETA